MKPGVSVPGYVSPLGRVGKAGIHGQSLGVHQWNMGQRRSMHLKEDRKDVRGSGIKNTPHHPRPGYNFTAASVAIVFVFSGYTLVFLAMLMMIRSAPNLSLFFMF